MIPNGSYGKYNTALKNTYEDEHKAVHDVRPIVKKEEEYAKRARLARRLGTQASNDFDKDKE